MKTGKILLCLGLCAILLAGCDLRNRQSSELYIPASLPQTEVPAPLPGQLDPFEPQQSDPGAALTDSRIRILLDRSGSFPYAVTPIAYSYQVPMLDLPGAQAAGCNQEIEARFGAPARESLEAMEQGTAPELVSVAFESYEHNGVLTLHLVRKDADGGGFEAYYTVNGANGERVSAKEMFRAAGLSDEDPQKSFEQALAKRFTQQFGGRDSAAEERYTTALTQTMDRAAAFNESWLHLTREGRLVSAAELFSPAGGSEWIELQLS